MQLKNESRYLAYFTNVYNYVLQVDLHALFVAVPEPPRESSGLMVSQSNAECYVGSHWFLCRLLYMGRLFELLIDNCWCDKSCSEDLNFQ